MIESSHVTLLWPHEDCLPGYIAALQRGWSPDNLRPQAAQDELAQIADDSARFLMRQVDREASGPPITLPDGSRVARLPGFRRWIWDGDFCGVIGLRWQRGTTDLPPHCPGHVGYSIVPWKRRRGYATRALRLFLQDARNEGLPFIDLVTEPDNVGSTRVIETNGGTMVGIYSNPTAHGGADSLRYRIPLGNAK